MTEDVVKPKLKAVLDEKKKQLKQLDRGAVFVVAAQKGGVGKSTLAVNMAVYLHKQGLDVILIDADPKNINSSSFMERREENGLGAIARTTQSGNVASTLQSLSEKFDAVIVDCRGGDSKEMRSSAFVADMVLCPCVPGQFDLETLVFVDDIMGGVMASNPNLRVFQYVSMSPHHNAPQKEVDAREAMDDLCANIHTLESIVRYRQDFALGSIEAKAVFELPSRDKKAAKEIMGLFEEIGLVEFSKQRLSAKKKKVK